MNPGPPTPRALRLSVRNVSCGAKGRQSPTHGLPLHSAADPTLGRRRLDVDGRPGAQARGMQAHWLSGRLGKWRPSVRVQAGHGWAVGLLE